MNPQSPDSPDVPSQLPPQLTVPLSDQASLERMWRRLMGELGFASPQLWLLFIDGDRPQHVVRIDDLPLTPTADEVAGLGRMLDAIADGSRTCAFLYARPGGPTRSTGDLAWARRLHELLGESGWPVHLANDVELRVVAPDDLAA